MDRVEGTALAETVEADGATETTVEVAATIAEAPPLAAAAGVAEPGAPPAEVLPTEDGVPGIAAPNPRRALAFGRDTLSLLAWAAGAGLATKAAGAWNTDEMAYFALMIGCVVLVTLLTDGYPRRLFGALGFAFSILYTLFLLDMADQRTAATAVGSESRDLLLMAIAGSMTLLLICILRLLPPRRQTG